MVRGTFSPARAWRPAVASGLTQTLGQAMRIHGASLFVAIAAAAAGRSQRPSSAPTTRTVGHVAGGQLQVQDARATSPATSSPKDDRSATRGKAVGAQSSAVQFVVRASRDSAAPGNQRVVYRGARGCGAGCTHHDGCASQQPEVRARRHTAVVFSSLNFSASRAQNAWPNPAVNRTPCGSPHLAFISFWAKRGLPQGAGYLVR